jgi:predicted ATPase
VGREQEVALLRERWAQVKDGTGQVVLLSGEAGIGKSRLVQVLTERVASEPQAWLTPCQCSPYYQNTALYPLIELLERVALRFDREESLPQKISKLEGFLVQYGLPLAEAVPLFTALLSLRLPADYAPLHMSREQQKQKTLHALLTILLKIAAQQPVLFVMEDLHWLDPTTLEFLSLLVDQGPTARILSSGFQPTVDGALACHPGDAAALAAAPGDGDDRPSGARQSPPPGSGGADRSQDRWGAAVCRGVDQDGAGVRPAPGAGGAL